MLETPAPLCAHGRCSVCPSLGSRKVGIDSMRHTHCCRKISRIQLCRRDIALDKAGLQSHRALARSKSLPSRCTRSIDTLKVDLLDSGDLLLISRADSCCRTVLRLRCHFRPDQSPKSSDLRCNVYWPTPPSLQRFLCHRRTSTDRRMSRS